MRCEPDAISQPERSRLVTDLESLRYESHQGGLVTGSEYFKLLGCLGLVLERLTTDSPKMNGGASPKLTLPNDNLEVTSGCQDVPHSVVLF